MAAIGHSGGEALEPGRLPEYWIVDPANLTIEQYVLVQEGESYDLQNVFGSDDTVKSEQIPCVHFVVRDGVRL